MEWYFVWTGGKVSDADSDEQPLQHSPRRRSSRKHRKGQDSDIGRDDDTSDEEPLERAAKRTRLSIPEVEVQGGHRTLRRSGREGSGRYLSINIRLS